MMWNLIDYENNTAVINENGEAVSYGELKSETDKLAAHVRCGRCLVFVLCSNELGSLTGYVSFINNRIVPLMLDLKLDRSLLDSLIQIYQPGYLWLPERMAAEFPGYNSVYVSCGYALIETGFADNCKIYDQLALLLTTSGSTGSPKLVRQSYANIRANTESIITYLGIDATERAVTTLPMHYTYGLSIINTHLYAGASLILTNNAPIQKKFWQQAGEYGATSFGGVPYTYEMLKRLRFLQMDLPSLRYTTQAGGKLSPELCLEYAQGLRQNGKDFIVMYGATEATSRMSYVPRHMSVEKAGSIGIAIPGGRFELIDADGGLIDKPDIVGELVYYGDNVTLGYAECRDDLAKPDERNGRLETGDMAKMDSDGYYYIVGRKKRFLKLYGHRVNLMEVELILDKQGYEAACVGEDDHMRIYTTCEDTAAVHAFIAAVMGINRIAFEVFHIGEIPRNNSGKVLYANLEG